VILLERSATTTTAIEYCSFLVVVETLSLLCATLGEGVLPLSCDVVAIGWFFLVYSYG
jgi:hypothetical protein